MKNTRESKTCDIKAKLQHQQINIVQQMIVDQQSSAEAIRKELNAILWNVLQASLVKHIQDLWHMHWWSSTINKINSGKKTNQIRRSRLILPFSNVRLRSKQAIYDQMQKIKCLSHTSMDKVPSKKAAAVLVGILLASRCFFFSAVAIP